MQKKIKPAELKFDLQVHSNHSDGFYSPSELIKIAKKQGIKILAITDHDTVAGLTEAKKTAIKNKIALIPGIELTVGYKDQELHLLGYGINPNNLILKRLILFNKKSREARAKKMVLKLNKLGFQISYLNIKKSAKESIARPHIARAIIDNKKNHQLLKKVFGKIPDASTFIIKYLVKGKPGYVEKQKKSIQEGINIIHQACGLAVLSHPLGRRFSFDISLSRVPHWQSILLKLKKSGLDGLEAYSTDHFNKDIKVLLNFAKKNELLVSGGSDFHSFKIPGTPLGYISKTQQIPFKGGENLLNSIKQRKAD